MIAPLNLDNSQPSADQFRATNLAGVVRYLSQSDPIKYAALSRVTGDLSWRDKLIADKVNELIKWQQDFTNPASNTGGTGTTTGVGQQYVDQGDNSLRREIAILAARIRAVQSAKIIATEWQEVDWQGGSKTRIRIPVGTDGINFDQATSILILWKADISKPSTAEPNPSPQWIYRQVQYGAETGFRVDDLFIEAPNVVNLVTPNSSAFVSYPSSTGYNAYTTARSLQVRVIISLADESQFNTDYDSGPIEFTPEELQNLADKILPLILPEIDKVYGNIYPIGSLYLTLNEDLPPALKRTGWAWEKVAAGRFLMGVGEGTDSNNVKKTATVGNNAGEYTHKLTGSEAPSSAGSLTVTTNKSSSRGGGLVQTHVASVSLSAGAGAEAQAHNNTPPGFGVNVFKRTA